MVSGSGFCSAFLRATPPNASRYDGWEVCNASSTFLDSSGFLADKTVVGLAPRVQDRLDWAEGDVKSLVATKSDENSRGCVRCTAGLDPGQAQRDSHVRSIRLGGDDVQTLDTLLTGVECPGNQRRLRVSGELALLSTRPRRRYGTVCRKRVHGTRVWWWLWRMWAMRLLLPRLFPGIALRVSWHWTSISMFARLQRLWAEILGRVAV